MRATGDVRAATMRGPVASPAPAMAVAGAVAATTGDGALASGSGAAAGSLAARRDLGALVAGHALGWLVAGNGVGLLLATLLLAPGLNAWLAPLTYGRWVPLHLDFQLYGWTALPLVGALLRVFGAGGRGGRLALAAWSAALLAGGASWLAGISTGKTFVEWRGGARLALVLALLALAGVLAAGWVAGWRHRRRGVAAQLALGALLVALLGVPLALWQGTDPGTYPPIDPTSGGPTATSLLGSTVGLLGALVAAPWLLGLPRPDGARARRVTLEAGTLLAACAVAFLLLPHDDRGNREPAQVAALVILLPWLALLPRYGRAFAWPAAARRWLGAFAAWGSLLLLSAIATFLPALLDRWKFTNALVAHAHVAMAGMTTAVAALLLVALGDGTRVPAALAARAPFWAWQAGTVLMVVALTSLGTLEARDPGLLFRAAEPAVTFAYGARWAAGAAMLAASTAWLVRAWPAEAQG